MYCKQCGNLIDNDSVYCSFCGVKQSENNKPGSVPRSNSVPPDSQADNTNSSIIKPASQKSILQAVNLHSNKYDPTYQKETDATSIGFVIFFIFLGISLYYNSNRTSSDDSNTHFLGILLIIGLFLRVFVTVWIVNIARRQNRNTGGWGFFAFVYPSIALMIIGQLKKLAVNIETDDNLSPLQNSQVLNSQAQNFLELKLYDNAIRFAEKSLELDANNKIASEILLQARLEVPIEGISNAHVQTVCRRMKDDQILTIISKNYKSVGADVLIGSDIAPDGEYHYKKGDRKLKVCNGKIEKVWYGN